MSNNIDVNFLAINLMKLFNSILDTYSWWFYAFAINYSWWFYAFGIYYSWWFYAFSFRV